MIGTQRKRREKKTKIKWAEEWRQLTTAEKITRITRIKQTTKSQETDRDQAKQDYI